MKDIKKLKITDCRHASGRECLKKDFLGKPQISKNISILHELALERGKNRGWYPSEWGIKDYENYLFEKTQTAS